MTSLSTLIAWFPTRELEIHRLHARDEEFRCACDDYEVAAKALEHWEHVEPNVVRAAEYRRLTEELAGEIAAHLDAALAPTAILRKQATPDEQTQTGDYGRET